MKDNDVLIQDVECGCCFEKHPFTEMVQCGDGHLFCSSCLNRYAEETVFGQGKVNIL